MTRTLLCTALLALATGCHIGGGFDTAEKRRANAWQEETDPPPAREQLPAEVLQGPPIVYLLVAG